MRYRRLLIAALLSAGCDSSTEPSTEQLKVHIDAVTPTSLTGTVNTAVTPVPTVIATDERGRPVQGVAIRFEVASGAGVIANVAVNTDSLGLASVGQWILGTTAGAQNLGAVSDRRSSVVFTAWATAGPAAQITRENDYGQVAAVGETLSLPLRVRVVDAFGNRVVHAPVTFTVLSGEGRIDGSTVSTDVLGVAQSGRWTLGSVPGVQQVKAQSAGNEVVFSAFACESCQKFLLFERDGSIYKTIGNRGQEIRLTEGLQPAWSPDGQRIAFAKSSGRWYDIYVMDADGSNVVRRTFYNGEAWSPGFQAPAWSPDGRKLVVTTSGEYDSDIYTGGIYIVSAADDGKEPVLIRNRAAAPAWSPDGSKIAFVGLGSDGFSELDVMNADGSDARLVVPVEGATAIHHPTWSPDSRRIAFAKRDLFKGTSNLYSVSLDGSALTRLTGGSFTRDPAWSPDGAWIAFTMPTVDASISIAFVPADSGGQPFILVAGGESPAWQPGPQRNWR